MPKRHQPSTCNPPKRNRRGSACVPARTSARRRFYTKNTRIVRGELNDGCALVGQHGRAHRHRPYPSPSYFPMQSHTNKITIYTQFAQTTSTAHVQSIQAKCIGGGACVPARTSAQRRFHAKNTRIVRGDNDGCALVGRRGRAHRRRPYPSPSYFSTQTYTNKITFYAQSSPNNINRPTRNPPYEMRRGGAYVPARTSA